MTPDPISPAAPMLFESDKGARFSPCGTYRYHLCRRWSAGGRFAAWIMLNPSTADALKNDPTIRRCIAFTKAWGYDGLDILNLFAFKATDPRVMVSRAAAGLDIIGPENDETIDRVIRKSRRVIAAWGAHKFVAERQARVLQIALGANVPVDCLGTTAAGYPRHPLYVPNSATLRLYTPCTNK